mmetsp:Transcript_21662/g.60106  ORF Transcript_21662/g.60106 Transcript_21662/m.60106 type:complete len:96 (+) Transcript_21662:334-621(+)
MYVSPAPRFSTSNRVRHPDPSPQQPSVAPPCCPAIVKDVPKGEEGGTGERGAAGTMSSRRTPSQRLATLQGYGDDASAKVAECGRLEKEPGAQPP